MYRSVEGQKGTKNRVCLGKMRSGNARGTEQKIQNPKSLFTSRGLVDIASRGESLQLSGVEWRSSGVENIREVDRKSDITLMSSPARRQNSGTQEGGSQPAWCELHALNLSLKDMGMLPWGHH